MSSRERGGPGEGDAKFHVIPPELQAARKQRKLDQRIVPEIDEEMHQEILADERAEELLKAQVDALISKAGKSETHKELFAVITDMSPAVIKELESADWLPIKETLRKLDKEGAEEGGSLNPGEMTFRDRLRREINAEENRLNKIKEKGRREMIESVFPEDELDPNGPDYDLMREGSVKSQLQRELHEERLTKQNEQKADSERPKMKMLNLEEERTKIAKELAQESNARVMERPVVKQKENPSLWSNIKKMFGG